MKLLNNQGLTKKTRLPLKIGRKKADKGGLGGTPVERQRTKIVLHMTIDEWELGLLLSNMKACCHLFKTQGMLAENLDEHHRLIAKIMSSITTLKEVPHGRII